MAAWPGGPKAALLPCGTREREAWGEGRFACQAKGTESWGAAAPPQGRPQGALIHNAHVRRQSGLQPPSRSGSRPEWECREEDPKHTVALEVSPGEVRLGAVAQSVAGHSPVRAVPHRPGGPGSGHVPSPRIHVRQRLGRHGRPENACTCQRRRQPGPHFLGLQVTAKAGLLRTRAGLRDRTHLPPKSAGFGHCY